MTCHFSLLDEPLIRARAVSDGSDQAYTLPGLLVALGEDAVRDFPALRPHQRHPWHALLVQLAAIALQHAGKTEPFTTAQGWRDALLALTPEHPDGAAWALIAPPDRPAFLQPPVPGETPSKWNNHLLAPDQLDMLVTSKNHDLKAARMHRPHPDDWLMALISLQTQEGFLGAGNYGISRMNGGFASRPALGAVPPGHWGRRWRRDLNTLLENRDAIAAHYSLDETGIALLWLLPWDGKASLAFDRLDPFYIEICRRVRLVNEGDHLSVYTSGSKAARIEAKQLNGQTGDPWTPINIQAAKALTLGAKGFDYKLAAELLFGHNATFHQPITQAPRDEDGREGIVILAQGVTRGQGKTEGYHERRIPLSPKVGQLMRRHQTDRLAALAEKRISDIAAMRSTLWSALTVLFDNGKSGGNAADGVKEKANRFVRPFEQGEDQRFFTELNRQVEADDPEQAYLDWLVSMAERAEAQLHHAFQAGPRSAMQRYRARSAALDRFRGQLRGPKSPLPILRDHYHEQQPHKERAHDDA